MKIKYITEDGLSTLRSNAQIVYKEIVKKGEKTLSDLFPEQRIIRETPFEIEEVVLDMSQPAGKETLTDAENVQRIYNHMKGLSDSQASDERIWVAYTLSEQLEYMKYRWKADNEKDMLNRYFFNYSNNRSLFRNGISRLWWIGRVTYDEKRSDPYELTKYICKDQDFIESICGRTIFNNPIVQKTTIKAIYDAEQAGIKIGREEIRNISKYVNLLAGTYLLDMLSGDEIYHKVYAKIASGAEVKNDM